MESVGAPGGLLPSVDVFAELDGFIQGQGSNLLGGDGDPGHFPEWIRTEGTVAGG
ncbi:hypothetical protein [Arthrobacter sp. HLT1-20]